MQGRIFYHSSLAARSQSGSLLGNTIFEGAKPADSPIEQRTKFQLVSNLKTAKALAIEIPPTLLGMANRMIEMNRNCPR